MTKIERDIVFGAHF